VVRDSKCLAGSGRTIGSLGHFAEKAKQKQISGLLRSRRYFQRDFLSPTVRLDFVHLRKLLMVLQHQEIERMKDLIRVESEIEECVPKAKSKQAFSQGSLRLHVSLVRSQKFRPLTSADFSLVGLPLFHGHGLIGATLSTLASGRSVIVPPRFSASEFWKLFSEHRATWFSAAHTIHQVLLERADGDGAPHSGPRFIRSCSAPLAPTNSDEDGESLRSAVFVDSRSSLGNSRFRSSYFHSRDRYNCGNCVLLDSVHSEKWRAHFCAAIFHARFNVRSYPKTRESFGHGTATRRNQNYRLYGPSGRTGMHAVASLVRSSEIRILAIWAAFARWGRVWALKEDKLDAPHKALSMNLECFTQLGKLCCENKVLLGFRKRGPS
jgi:hypothetical protein